ncbi:BMP family lipoprotein [Desulfopila aestuarii]|uniref:Basic membrane protein A n=1 Tax=Desulfopila aestuarii DSM 18488 TaxID=1121416 RepID=A0A1M7Y4Q9_9BACT|nr:BMP family ABC transporter substrate-binding protein [Desulfopila aestuarii]SHO47339.1 basic membrane protein A [Desulfopila aestuarii DSM 18488]
MKKNIFTLLLLVLLAFPASIGHAATIVGFLVPASGLGDESFNDMTYTGLIEAKTRHNFRLIREQCTGGSDDDRRKALEQLFRRGADIIVVNGWQYRNLIKEYALRSPKRFYIINDFPVDGVPNVISSVFAQHEGAFLAGALAGWMTQNDKIGFIGGMDMPVIRAFQSGFHQGALYANPKVRISDVFLASDQDAFAGFSSPSLGFSMANKLYDSDVDIIFGAAGLSNQGIIQAARRRKLFAIGADADQDHMAPGYVLTSVMKRLDTATSLILDKLMRGEPISGIQRFGLKENGVALSYMTYTREVIPKEIQQRLEQLREKIIAGEIPIADPLQESVEKGE